MTHPIVNFLALAIASVLASWPSNCLIWFLWERIANREHVAKGEPTALVRSVGTLERILYIAGVIGHHYELIAGWLVLKAFFEIARDRCRLSPVRYNSWLVGNLLSLMTGLFLGVLANLAIRLRIGVTISWWP